MAPNWKPLVAKLGKKRCVGFMFMGRVNGINLYKHGITRMYLNLDDSGECYVSCENCVSRKLTLTRNSATWRRRSLNLGRIWKVSTMSRISSKRDRLCDGSAFRTNELRFSQKIYP